MYPFGQDLTVWHFPLVDNEPPTLSSSMQAQSPAIYVFATRPSRDAAADGTGATGSAIAAWTWDAARSGWFFTVPAIDDPTPDSEDDRENYWLSLNYRLTSGEQTQTVLQYLPLVRVRGVAQEVLVTENELRAIFAGVDTYGTSAQRLAAIAEAKGLLKAHLTAKGFEWQRIHNLQDLSRGVAYKALALICLGQNQLPGDKFFIKYGEYSTIAQGLFDALKLEYDSTNDGAPDSAQPSGNMVLALR